MSNQKRGLGRGLDALFDNNPEVPVHTASPGNGAVQVAINDIDPNPYQPRKEFNREKLDELAQSIKEHGLIQPILATKSGARYTLVAGERRWRAARIAGLSLIPVIVKNFTSRQMAEIALIENLQRDDLNPIEEARGIKHLMDEYSLTQEAVASRLGKSRPAVTNTLRLLTLPDDIIEQISLGNISSGHGRALVGIENKALQKKLCSRIIEEGLSVRQLETIVKDSENLQEPAEKAKKPEPPAEFRELAKMLESGMGSRVQISGDLKSGKITIRYSSRQELENIYSIAKSLRK